MLMESYFIDLRVMEVHIDGPGFTKELFYITHRCLVMGKP